MKSINIGQLNQRITIKQRTLTQNAIGEEVWSFSTYATVWANVMPTGGGEGFEANEKTARRYIDILIRAGGLTLDETMRITWNGSDWNILSIDEYGLTNGKKVGYTIKALSKD